MCQVDKIRVYYKYGRWTGWRLYFFHIICWTVTIIITQQPIPGTRGGHLSADGVRSRSYSQFPAIAQVIGQVPGWWCLFTRMRTDERRERVKMVLCNGWPKPARIKLGSLELELGSFTTNSLMASTNNLDKIVYFSFLTTVSSFQI